MKRFFVMLLTATLTVGALPVMGFAASTNTVSRDISASEGMELTGANVPELRITDEEGTTGDFYFELTLNNATWLDSITSQAQSGITFTLLSDTRLMVQVTDGFDFQNNDIVIPLATEVEDAGQATVTIDPKDSTISAGTYAFAHVNYPGMSIQMEESEDGVQLMFEDDYPYAMRQGRLFQLTLSRGYTFDTSATVEAEGTGKYNGRVEFRPMGENSSTAYVQISSASATGEGTITVSGIRIKGSAENAPVLSVKPVYGSGSSISYTLMAPEGDSEEDQAPAVQQKQVKFVAGGNYYVVDNDSMVAMEAAPFIDENGRTMLPLRALSNAIGIDANQIHWDDATKTVTIEDGSGKEIRVTIGQQQIYVDNRVISMDTQAVIRDGYTYLPMRAVLNALGFDDSNIVWNEREKSVTITWEEATQG